MVTEIYQLVSNLNTAQVNVVQLAARSRLAPLEPFPIRSDRSTPALLF
jgi:hypothetical protein